MSTAGMGNRLPTKAEDAFREVVITAVARHPGLTGRELAAMLAIPEGWGNWDIEAVLLQACFADPGRPARLSMAAGGSRFYPLGAVPGEEGERNCFVCGGPVPKPSRGPIGECCSTKCRMRRHREAPVTGFSPPSTTQEPPNSVAEAPTPLPPSAAPERSPAGAMVAHGRRTNAAHQRRRALAGSRRR